MFLFKTVKTNFRHNIFLFKVYTKRIIRAKHSIITSVNAFCVYREYMIQL